MGRYVKKHIYGEGIRSDVLKSIGKKVFGQTVKEFFYLDTNRNAKERAAQANYNKSFPFEKHFWVPHLW